MSARPPFIPAANSAARWQSLPEEVRRLAIHHPVIQTVADQFAKGCVETHGQALVKIIVELARQNDITTAMLLKYIERFGAVETCVSPLPPPSYPTGRSS